MTKKQKNRLPRSLRAVLIVLAAIAVAALLAVSVCYALYWHGRAAMLEHGGSLDTPNSLVDNVKDEGRLVTYKGEDYLYNEDVVSLLLLGVDKSYINTNASHGKNGQADSLFVATLDTRTGAVKIIPLSREIMADVNLYDADGAYLGVEKLQLCLAYAYAATPEEGCENVARSVNRLLYGMPIDGCVAIDLEGLKALTSAVGGVTVSVLEDVVVNYDPNNYVVLKKGQDVTLSSETVIPYIRQRGQDVDANNRRMQRQQQFLNNFIHVASNKIKGNFTLLEKYYNAIKPYTVSDLTLSKITYLASTYLIGGQRAIDYLPVSGDTTLGEEYVEFRPDETALYEAVLAAFYTKAEHGAS